MFMIVFGTYCNLYIVLSIRLKTCRSNGFFFFMSKNVHAQKIEHVSEVLSAPVRLIGIGRAICQGLNISRRKGSQTMKFGQFIEYNMRNIFPEKSYTKYGGKTNYRPCFRTLLLSISPDQ